MKGKVINAEVASRMNFDLKISLDKWVKSSINHDIEKANQIDRHFNLSGIDEIMTALNKLRYWE